MASPQPFKVSIPQQTLDRIAARVRDYRWFPAPEGESWEYGTNTAYLKALCAYWLKGYDWRAREAELNRFPQFIADLDGLPVHFVHVVGEAGGKRPLIAVHGWPGSHYEFWGAIEKLAFPSRFGGSSADAFDVVAPSLPGYGFSGKPRKPFGQAATAKLFDTLMTETLGYKRYLAQGGDWGSLVCSLLARDYEACAAVHLNMIPFQPAERTPQNDAEKAWLAKSAVSFETEGAYFREQSTKPQTLALGLMDSPVGVAAWTIEKFKTWSDLKGEDLESVYTKDQLLTNVMIYLVTDSFATSVWYYRAGAEEGGFRGPPTKVAKPTGVAAAPDIAFTATPPRSWVERAYNVVHWTDVKPGGHFLAMEQPDAYVADVRAFARTVNY